MAKFYQRTYFQWKIDIGLAKASPAIVGCIYKETEDERWPDALTYFRTCSVSTCLYIIVF